MQQQADDYDVVIIGAGWSGLLAAKYCLDEGLRTLVLECRDGIGGVWRYTDDQRFGGVMETTRTTSSRCITEISDFPMPADYPDFPSHRQINAYLESYCARFSLTEHISLNQEIERVAKVGERWQIDTSSGSVFSAKSLIVASGVHRHLNDLAQDERFRHFSGTLVHSTAIKGISAKFSGKTVIVWGGGESASDIAFEASALTSRLYWCIPNGQWFVPRVVDRWPPFPSARPKVVDHTTSRLRLRLSRTHQYSPFIYQYLEYAFGFNGHGQEAWRSAAPYNRSFHNKAAEVLDRVKSRQVIPRRDISHCDGTLVHFTDGSSVAADFIIVCSGYRTSFPYFSSSVAPDTDPRKWFKYIFHDADPSLAFIGFVRPVFGSIPGISELQSRYVAKVFSGECRLPEPADRAVTIAADAKFWNHHFRFTSKRIAGLVDHYLYSDQLARLIGCYPNFPSLLISSPSRWWRAMLAPWNGCQFWLNDARHHDRIFETFHRNDDNRISQNYIFLALAPVLPLIGLNTQLRVALGEWLVRRKNAVRSRGAAVDSWWRPARGLAIGPYLAAEAAGNTSAMLEGGFPGDPPPASAGSRAGLASVEPASARRSEPPPGDDVAPRATVSTAVIANVVEMLSGRLSREQAANYIDPQITIHMDSATHRGIELWQKWLYLIRNCGRLRQLRLVPSELSADPQDPAIVNLLGRWVGVGRHDGVPREASHTSHFRYRLANNRVVELWTHKTNYDGILGKWIRFSVLYRLYLGWAIFLFRSLSRKGLSYHIDRSA
ncbi:MAG: NAD(P)-binding domain-containing protein [Pseudomonadota bacterium]|nr:NAD(P)-binding domain-containing protein [Pseudomonadota bacterium]